MPSDIFEVFSQGMRYFFTLLGILIVWFAFAWQLSQHRLRHKLLRRLPDAGRIGELVVITGSRELPQGTVLPMPYEGTLGSQRQCDLSLPCEGVARQHLDFSFQPKKGVLLFLRSGQTCLLDGKKLDARSKPRRHPMVHGSVLTIGQCEVRVRLFAGLDAGKPRGAKKNRARTDEPASPSPQENIIMANPQIVPDTPLPDFTPPPPAGAPRRRSPNVPMQVNHRVPMPFKEPVAEAPKRQGRRRTQHEHNVQG